MLTMVLYSRFASCDLDEFADKALSAIAPTVRQPPRKTPP
jgi:hypothetical protein